MKKRGGRDEVGGQLDLFGDWQAEVDGGGDHGPVISETVDNVTATPPVDSPVAPTFDQMRYRLAVALAEKLNVDGEISSGYLTQTATAIFGGTPGEGIYTSKDAYDAMEAAFNIHLVATESRSWASQGAEWAAAKAEELNQRIQRLPTQTRRDPEMDEFQQFSTPPALAFVANWVGNVQPGDRMLEPSAGTGDLAIWSQIAGADIILNELAPRRHALLSQLFPDAALFRENAEQLDNVLPLITIPSVIVMNPPFSSTAGRVQGQRDTANGARHIEQALKRLAEGGRLVAIVGQGMAADRPAFRGWWKTIQDSYSVRANIGIDGREYAKYGTTFDNQILVIDKLGPTTQPVVTGQVASVAELPALLETIRYERRDQDRTFAIRGQDEAIQPGPREQAGGGDPGEVQDTVHREEGVGGADHDSGSVGPGITGNADAAGTSVTDSKTDGNAEVGDGVDDGRPAGGDLRDRPAGESGAGRSGGDGTRGDNGSDHEPAGSGVTVLA
jgi:predicted RNA methylase